MALIPYEPFRQLDNMRREFGRMFEGWPSFFHEQDERFGMPRIDLHETDHEIVATCDLPGVEKKEDIHIDIQNNVLTISGVIDRSHEVKENQIHRKERFEGRFQRSITLPANVSQDNIQATYRNGVLKVHMPKIEDNNRKRIDIQFH